MTMSRARGPPAPRYSNRLDDSREYGGEDMATMTPKERARYDAQAEVEAWELALSILTPWVESARPIGSDELTRVMEEALEKAEGELRRARREWKEAEAAL